MDLYRTNNEECQLFVSCWIPHHSTRFCFVITCHHHSHPAVHAGAGQFQAQGSTVFGHVCSKCAVCWAIIIPKTERKANHLPRKSRNSQDWSCNGWTFHPRIIRWSAKPMASLRRCTWNAARSMKPRNVQMLGLQFSEIVGAGCWCCWLWLVKQLGFLLVDYCWLVIVGIVVGYINRDGCCMSLPRFDVFLKRDPKLAHKWPQSTSWIPCVLFFEIFKSLGWNYWLKYAMFHLQTNFHCFIFRIPATGSEIRLLDRTSSNSFSLLGCFHRVNLFLA